MPRQCRVTVALITFITTTIMLATQNNRLDPALIPEEQIARLSAVFAKPGRVALVDSKGKRTKIPDILFAHFGRIVRLMFEGKAIVLMPEDETFTTQAAANYLGMSRQHLVGLLEKGEIPHHKVGTHRRVAFKGLLAYEKKRARTRRAALDRLAAEVDAAGLYDSGYTGGE